MSGLLKFITCGSVDDGKSTLIGHMLYDSKLLYADQKKALLLDSKVGSRGGDIDYSLLLDGLMAEREQGITIDVAYRYFTTDQRSFIVADTPGHEEYTRNMAVGASFAQLAVILVDATQGILVQTRRHSRICALMGIHYFVFAVNKMDLVQYSEKRFQSIVCDIQKLAKQLDLKNVMVIPVSATEGDNITRRSENMKWYTGSTLLDYLENVDVSENNENTEFYLPVQRVCRPNHTFRGFAGQVESGVVKFGQRLVTLPSRETATVQSLLVGDKQADRAYAGQAVTIQLDREVDVSRGCVLTSDVHLPVSRRITATLLWMDDETLTVGREYLAKLGTKRIPAVVKNIQYKIDVNSGEQIPTQTASKNELVVCELEFTEKIVVDEFRRNKTLGELILIDRVSHMTSACGVVEHVNSNTEKPVFADGSLQVGGYLYDELYFNPETVLLSCNPSQKVTYHIGDRVPDSGDSFHYPANYDVLSAAAQTAVFIRNGAVARILPLADYLYTGQPVLDERGLTVNIASQEEFKRFLTAYQMADKKKLASLRNQWISFGNFRRAAFTDTF